MKKLLPLLLLAGCSKPSIGGVQFIPYAQAVDVAAQNCNAVTETLIITPDGGNCPTTALAGRRSITLCSDPRNALILLADAGLPIGGPFMAVRSDQQDGGAASMGDQPGIILAPGDCVAYALTAGQPTRCATDTYDAGLRILECR